MPIHFKENGKIELSGLEEELINTLHSNLLNNLPIDDVLKKINQTEHPRLLINIKKFHPEDRDYYSAVHLAARKGNVSALTTLIRLSTEDDSILKLSDKPNPTSEIKAENKDEEVKQINCDELPAAPGGPRSHTLIVDDCKKPDKQKPKEFLGFGSLGCPVTFFLSKNASQKVNSDLLESKFDSNVGWYVHLSSKNLDLDVSYKGENIVFKNEQLWIDGVAVIENDSRLIAVNKSAR